MLSLQQPAIDAGGVAGWWSRESRLLGLTFLAALLVYFYPVSTFTLHIDGETQAVYTAVMQTLLLGRWGTSLLHATLLPEPAVPYLTPLLSLMFMTLAAVEAGRIVGLERLQRLVFAVLYVGLPQFAYQMEFSNQNECVALGILCSTFGYGLFLDGGLGRRCAGLLLCVLGLSFYPSIVFIVPVICTLRCLQAVRCGQAGIGPVLRDYLAALVLTLAAYALCAAIARLAQQHYHLPDSTYLDQMIGWYHRPFRAALAEAAHRTLAYLRGGGFYGNGVYVLALISAAAIALVPPGGPWRPAAQALSGALALAALVAPFVIVLLLGAAQPPRTYLAEPLAFAGLLAIAPGKARARPALVAAVVGAILISDCFCVSRLFFADTMASVSDRLLGNRIVETIYRTYPDFDAGVVPVYFRGAYAAPNIWRRPDFDVFGASFFTWDGGNPVRIGAFLKATGIADLRLANEAEVARIRAAALSLPDWPNPRAVSLIDGVMIVKLGE